MVGTRPPYHLDNAGRIHVAFYDDRDFPAQVDTTDKAKFEAYYAVSSDNGITFQNYKLSAATGEPAVDENLGTSGIKEYSGLTFVGNTVWIAFAGNSSLDTGQLKEVVYVVRADF